MLTVSEAGSPYRLDETATAQTDSQGRGMERVKKRKSTKYVFDQKRLSAQWNMERIFLTLCQKWYIGKIIYIFS